MTDTEFRFDDPAVHRAAPTVLDGLLADLADLPEPSVTMQVPARPQYAVSYSTELAYERFAQIRKGAQDKMMPGGVNEIRMATNILVDQCRGIVLDGEPLTDQGEPLTYFSPTLHRLLGVSTPQDAVRKFYGRDGHVLTAATAVIGEAGYGGGDADPTTSG